KPTEQRSSD
ncbi:hypothetical protein PF006_g32178, partial [Phytophthora fragariae]